MSVTVLPFTDNVRLAGILGVLAAASKPPRAMIAPGAHPPSDEAQMPAWNAVKQVQSAVTVAPDVPPGLTRTDESCVARSKAGAFGVE